MSDTVSQYLLDGLGMLVERFYAKTEVFFRCLLIFLLPGNMFFTFMGVNI